MPILPNEKHEMFASLLAKGMSSSVAYVNAGYKRNLASASRLARSKAISERVTEIREANNANLVDKIEATNMGGGYGDVYVDIHSADVDMGWVIMQYKRIYKAAMDINQLAPANAAVANIQKIVDSRETANAGKIKNDEPLISIGSMLSLMQGMSNMIEKGKMPEPQLMIDITPTEEVLPPLAEIEYIEIESDND